MLRFVIRKSIHINKQFVSWLLGRIKHLLISSIDVRNLAPYAEYINENLVTIDVMKLKHQLIRYIMSLYIVETEFDYIIQPKYHLVYKGIPLSALVDIVEFGSLSIKGLYRFARVYDYVQREIKAFYVLYCKKFIVR